MSLDVYLNSSEIFICPHCKQESPIASRHESYWANITHNLGTMADKAGIYKALWRPEEINAKQAKDIIPLLKEGLKQLKKRPAYFAKFNATNGWGMYEHFVPFVEKYLDACLKDPDAIISVSR